MKLSAFITGYLFLELIIVTTYSQCTERCNRYPVQKRSSELYEEGGPIYVCYLPPDQGDFGDAIYIRWYHNPKSRKCEILRYTGSGGNANRFMSRYECERACIYLAYHY